MTVVDGRASRSAENPYAGQGSVLLDIGGHVGALVVTMPAELAGEEVEINRRECDGRERRDHDHDVRDHDVRGHDHGHHHRPHVAVVARPVAAGGVVHSLVFAELVEGDYELYRRPDGPVELSVSIIGGTVTETVWPAGLDRLEGRGMPLGHSDGGRDART